MTTSRPSSSRIPYPFSFAALPAGFVVTLASVVYSAFQAGSNSALFSLQRPDEEAAGVPLLPTGEAEEASTSAGLDGAPQVRERNASCRVAGLHASRSPFCMSPLPVLLSPSICKRELPHF